MNIALNKSVDDYLNSLEKVIQKRKLWKAVTCPLILRTLKEIQENYNIGWCIQELDWLLTNKAVNLTFETFPPVLSEKLTDLNDFEFLKGAALVFSQKYNGDIYVFILYPDLAESNAETDLKELGTYDPDRINEDFVMEKVIDFLEEIIVWEGSVIKRKVGF
jgi:hypothetical protein